MAVSDVDKSKENQLVSFILGSEEYGVEIVKVQEIIKVPDITRVPRAPEYVLGVVNLRGNILPIIDTRIRFGMDSIEQKDSTRIIVADINGMTVGMVVDSVSEVLRISGEKVEDPPDIIVNSSADYLKGIGKLNNGSRLISLLALEKVLDLTGSTGDVSSIKRRKSADDDKKGTASKSEQEAQMVSFLLGSEEYAIEIDLVEEIIRVPEITMIPDMPYHIEGVISLRGRVLPILNLRKKFNMPVIDFDNRTRILIVRTEVSENLEDEKSECGDSFGIIVDFVNEVISFSLNAIELPARIISGGNARHIKGIGKLNGGKRLIIQLDTAEIYDNFGKKAMANKGIASAGKASEGGASMDEQQLVIFKISQEEFGINIMNVQEIIRTSTITEIPGSQYFVEGVVNLRGGVLPVIDLRKIFGLDSKEKNDSNRIVVVNSNGSPTGIIVDSVCEVLQLNNNSIEPPPAVVSGIQSGFIEGIGKLKNGDRFIIILDLKKILNPDEAQETDEFENMETLEMPLELKSEIDEVEEPEEMPEDPQDVKGDKMTAEDELIAEALRELEMMDEPESVMSEPEEEVSPLSEEDNSKNEEKPKKTRSNSAKKKTAKPGSKKKRLEDA